MYAYLWSLKNKTDEDSYEIKKIVISIKLIIGISYALTYASDDGNSFYITINVGFDSYVSGFWFY